MFLTPYEILDMAIMIAAIGFIFMKIFKPKTHKGSQKEDILDKYLRKTTRFDWHAFWFACMVVAPAILFHELAHKITAISFGLSAEFHAAYSWLLIGIVLRLISFPFLFFVPAYVSIVGNATILQHTLTAFAGPFLNFILWMTALIVLKTNKRMNPKYVYFWHLTKTINMFLFIFNMLPIPMFDGFHIFSGLWKLIGL